MLLLAFLVAIGYLFFWKQSTIEKHKKSVFVLFETSDVLIGSRNFLSEGSVELASFTADITLYFQSHFINPPSGSDSVYPPHPLNTSSPSTRMESCPGFPTKVCPIEPIRPGFPGPLECSTGRPSPLRTNANALLRYLQVADVSLIYELGCINFWDYN